MKRLVNHKRHFELEIVVVMNNIAPLGIAASKHPIKLDPRKLQVEYQLTPQEMAIYKNFLSTVASIIENQGFIFIDEYQSSESYSYYLQFTPVMADSNTVLDVKFRLSNHNLPNAPIKHDSGSYGIYVMTLNAENMTDF